MITYFIIESSGACFWLPSFRMTSLIKCLFYKIKLSEKLCNLPISILVIITFDTILHVCDREYGKYQNANF